jgi:hypothetical protein
MVVVLHAAACSATMARRLCYESSGEVSGESSTRSVLLQYQKKKLLDFLCFFATLAYCFCYHISSEISGDVSGEFPGDISDEFFCELSDEVGVATIPEFFCYNSTTFLLHRLRRGLRRISDEICVYFG